MTRFNLIVSLGLVVMSGFAYAAPAAPPGPLRPAATIGIPGEALDGFDISSFSDAQNLYGFSDRSNHAVDLIDPDTDRFVGRVEGFGKGGPNGLVAVGSDHFWAGDGDSKLRVIDIRSRKIIATVDTGGRQRVDELAYDPRDHLVVAVNNDDAPPFVSFVSTAPGHRIVGKLPIPQASHGLEQPLWDPTDGLVYLSVPVLDRHKARGGIAVINPRTHHLIGVIPVHQCMPAGLALGRNGRALVGCSDDAVAAGFAPRSLIVDLRQRKVVATIMKVGGSDEVWYDSGSGRYYVAAVANTGGPVLGVVNAKTDAWVRNLPTGKDAHSVAADPRNGKVFVPIAATHSVNGCGRGCVKVFARRGGPD